VFASRDLSEFDITYLFVDGIAERLHLGHLREAVLAAWRILAEYEAAVAPGAGDQRGHRQLPGVFPRDAPAWVAHPLLVVSDGRSGSSARSRNACRAPLPAPLGAQDAEPAKQNAGGCWSEFKGPCHGVLPGGLAGLGAPAARRHRNPRSRFAGGFVACTAYLKFPLGHRRAVRTTNILERLFGKERRRIKVIPYAFGESAVLKLMYAALIRAAKRWRGIKVSEFAQRQLRVIRDEIDKNFTARNAPNNERNVHRSPAPFIQQSPDLTLPEN
jgi:hypothetical protein